MIQKFDKRLVRLEQWLTPRRRPRVLLCFEGPGSEDCPQPTAEELAEGWPVVTVRVVAAKDGRPATPEEIARGDTSDGQTVVDNRKVSATPREWHDLA